MATTSNMNSGAGIKAKAMNAVQGAIDFIKNPKKVIGLAMAGASLSLLTACGPSSEPEAPVSPLPAPSKIDKTTSNEPNTEPNTPATEKPGNGEVNDPSQLECVGQKFSHTTSNGLEIVDESDAQRAYDCVKVAGQVELMGKKPSATIYGYYKFSAKDSESKIITFTLSDDWMNDEENFSILRASIQGQK